MVELEHIHDDAYRWKVIADLMQAHGDAVTQYCYTWLGEGLAEEMTQEVFVTAWERLPSYQPQAPLRTWLFGIARNKCQQAYRNRVRRQAIAQTFLQEIHVRAHAGQLTSPEEQLVRVSDEARLANCLGQLRDEDRIMITLRYWKDMPVADIADIMGKSVAAVRKRLTRAQHRLKELMHEHVATKSDAG